MVQAHALKRALVGAAIVALVTPAAAAAQSAWLELEGSGVALEYRRLVHSDLDNVDLFSGAYFLTGHFELRDRVQIVAELPWARIGSTEEDLLGEEPSESALGNLYVGFGRQAREGASGFDVGVRLPTASEDGDFAAFYAHLTTVVDRIGAYPPETLSLIGGVGGSYVAAEHTELRGRLGLTYLHYTGEGDADGEAYARLTAQSITTYEAVRLGAGLETLFFLTGDSGNAGERSLLGLVLNGGYDFGMVATGLQVHVPLDDDYQDFADFVLGLSVEVTLP